MIDLNRVRIFVRPGKTDLRKAANGLSIIAESVMEQFPLSGDLFLFCNAERRLLKILYWNRNGFCLWQKRLEQDKFPWPDSIAAAREITREQLDMLFDGIDFWHAHQTLHYESVSGL